jgi:hypothetical protein
MKEINREKCTIKNLMGLVKEPTHEDLLFEIVSFMEDERRFDGEFKKWDVTTKTRFRIGENLDEDLKVLQDKGYIEHLKYSQYKILKHPWEKE